MAKAAFALATVLLAATTAIAVAEPSYESRGYGGPLGVGPNFHSSESYSSPERSKPKRVYKERSSEPKRRSRAVDTDDTPKSAPVKKEAENQKAAETENSSIAGATSNSAKTVAIETPAPGKVKAGVEKENSTIARASLDDGKTTSATETKPAETPKTSQNVGCKKYFPTAGMTLSVPCE